MSNFWSDQLRPIALAAVVAASCGMTTLAQDAPSVPGTLPSDREPQSPVPGDRPSLPDVMPGDRDPSGPIPAN